MIVAATVPVIFHRALILFTVNIQPHLATLGMGSIFIYQSFSDICNCFFVHSNLKLTYHTMPTTSSQSISLTNCYSL